MSNVTVIGTVTHTTACAACNATIGLWPESGLDYDGRPTDAHAVVVRGAAVASLPALPALVWFTCPACDAWQRRD